jgi:restriction system protein
MAKSFWEYWREFWDMEKLAEAAMGAQLAPPPPPSYGTPAAAASSAINQAVLLSQAIIIPGDKTNEGHLVEAVNEAFGELVKYFVQNPDAMFKVDPRKLEEIVAAMYAKRGFEVTLTPRSADKGRDVIAVKHGFGSVRLLESVKRYREDRKVTAEEVQALLGVLMTDSRASKGLVTTTSEFAPGIYKNDDIIRHIPFRLELVNGAELLKRLAATPK